MKLYKINEESESFYAMALMQHESNLNDDVEQRVTDLPQLERISEDVIDQGTSLQLDYVL